MRFLRTYRGVRFNPPQTKAQKARKSWIETIVWYVVYWVLVSIAVVCAHMAHVTDLSGSSAVQHGWFALGEAIFVIVAAVELFLCFKSELTARTSRGVAYLVTLPSVIVASLILSVATGW